MMIYQPFKKTAKIELECFDKRLNSLEAKVDGITDAIDNLECYSYQYNLKLVGIPELKAKKSWTKTSNLCVLLFKEMGVTSISLEDIDIAHRVPARNDSRYKPIICKFSRRIVKEQDVNCRRNINKVNPNSAGLPPGSQLSEARVYYHITVSIIRSQSVLSYYAKFTETLI